MRRAGRSRTQQARTFQRSLGKGRPSAVWMVRFSVLVHTLTGMVAPSEVCAADRAQLGPLVHVRCLGSSHAGRTRGTLGANQGDAAHDDAKQLARAEACSLGSRLWLLR